MFWDSVLDMASQFAEVVLQPSIVEMVIAATWIFAFSRMKRSAAMRRLAAGVALIWAANIAAQVFSGHFLFQRPTDFSDYCFTALRLVKLSGWLLVIRAAFVERTFAPVKLRGRFTRSHLILAVTFVAIFAAYVQYFGLVESLALWATQLRSRYWWLLLETLLFMAAGTIAALRRPQPVGIHGLLTVGCAMMAISTLGTILTSFDFAVLYAIGSVLVFASAMLDRPVRQGDRAFDVAGGSPSSLVGQGDVAAVASQSVYDRCKPWLAAAIVLAGTALPWMKVTQSTTGSALYASRSPHVSQRIDLSCSAWTTEFKIGALPIPLGETITLGTVLAALFAGYRGTEDGRGTISQSASIATIALVFVFGLVLCLSFEGRGGIGMLTSLCGLVWQAMPAAHSPRCPETPWSLSPNA